MTVRSCTSEPGVSVSTALRTLEACLLDYSGVLDCAVMVRAGNAETALVAYVVTQTSISVLALREHARTHGLVALPDDVVRVSTIPLTGDGQVDESALAQLPVISASDLERHHAVVLATPGVAAVEIGRAWPVADSRELRAADLLPEPARARTHRTAPGRAVRLDPNAAPSLSVAEPLDWQAGHPDTIADVLVRAATLEPEHTLTCVDADGEDVCSYSQLVDRADRIRTGLRAAGLHAGDTVIFQFDRNPDFIAAFWGCVLGGFVPAPLAVPMSADPGSSAATKLRNGWLLLGRPRVLTTAALLPALTELRDRLGEPALEFLTLERAGHAPAEGERHRARPDDLALLLLTSGSTGVPKAVMQTHAALISGCAGMAQRNGFTSRDVLVNWIALDHVGGLVMSHLLFVTVAGRQVHARTDYVLQDPLRWLDLIERHRASYTWAPNFAYALVNDRASDVATRHWDLSSMAFILNGGEAVVAATARRFLRLLAPHGLPATSMRPAWGMSETCSAATFSGPLLADATDVGDGLVEVGPPNPGFEIRIVNDRGDPVPEGSSGRLEVRGPNVTRGYFNNPEANAESFTTDGWFRTGDLGRLSGGRLTITGREKGVIIINGANYHAHEVEAAVEDVPGVSPSFAAAFAVREPGADTDGLAVAFHTSVVDDKALAELLRRVRTAVLERVGASPRYLLPVSREDIPKTDIGKIQRPALASRFEAGSFDAVTQRVAQLTSRGDTVPDWFFKPVWRQRRATSSCPLAAGSVVVLVGARSAFTSAIEMAVRATGARCLECGPGELGQCLANVTASERLVILYCDQYARRPDSNGQDDPHAAERAVAGVVTLLQTIAGSTRGARASELIVCDDAVHHVVPQDSTVVAKSCVLGMLRTAAAEHPQMSIRHVDLSPAGVDAMAAYLLAEIDDRRDEPEVAYRNGARWVRRLASCPPVPAARGHQLGRTDGFYLVTGGTGGIGAEVCRHLLRSGDAPLLLVSRTAPADMSEAQRATVASIQSLGETRVDAVDVADFDALERVVTEAGRRWGRPLAGVIHLAGVFEPRLIVEQTPEALATALRAKVHGTWSVHRLLLQHPAAVLVAFSSVNGHLGGYSAGAYAAANAFVDGLVRHHAVELGRSAFSLGWSFWDGVGLSRTYALAESAERRGYRAVSRPQGLLSLLAAVGGEPGHLLIGLDGGNSNIQRFVEDRVVSETMTARWVRGTGADAVTLPSFVDRFGTAVSLSATEMAGGVAAHRGGDGAMAGGGAAAVACDNDLERAIAAVWRDILPAGHVGPNDNFFDAGGNSLLVASVSRALQRTLGRDVPITDIYRFPTLRLLAAHYGGRDTADASGLDASEERGQTRRAMRLQRSRRQS